MNCSADVITGRKGQTVCRPSTWTDVFMFFVLNYGLHVFTVISPPGSPPFHNFCSTLLALVLPFSGIYSALTLLFHRWSQDASGDLDVAHRAGALCMLIRRDPDWIVPRSLLGLSIKLRAAYISRYIVLPGTTVHGQYPSTTKSNVSDDSENSAPPVIYDLIRVPRSFTVNPPPNSGPTPIKLTYNYNILQGVAGIIQILSGSFSLYQVSQRQLSRLGYASYSLTVVPYILMSFLNLLATMCERQYPSMFLVIYRGLEPTSLVADNPPVTEVGPKSSDDIAAVKSERTGGPKSASDPLEVDVIGVVGEAYGDLSQRLIPRTWSFYVNATLLAYSVVIGGLSCIAAPYIIIYLLTGFRAGDSTRSQRAWFMAWLVISQFYGLLRVTEYLKKNNSGGGRLLILFIITYVGTAAIGGFVVVGQMIMNDAFCTVL